MKSIILGAFAALVLSTVSFAQSERVFVAPFDIEALEFTGTPVAVHPRAWVDQGQIQMDVSDEGTVAYMPISQGEGQALVAVDLDGKVEDLVDDAEQVISAFYRLSHVICGSPLASGATGL